MSRTMRFIIKQIDSVCERVGTLSEFNRLPDTIIETPTAALLTKGASVTHMTADVLSKVFNKPQLLWVPLSSTLHLQTGAKAQGLGIAKFASLPNNVACSTFHGANEITPPGHFEADKVPLWTRNGKKMMTADRYMDVMEVFKPDIIIAIADDRTSLSEGTKRLTKSVERTCNLLDICMKRYKASPQLQKSAFIGVLVGAGSPKDCETCLKRLLLHKDSLSGVALSGLTDGPGDSMKVTSEQLEPIFKKLGESIPKNLLRIVEGCWNPAIIVSAIEHGWDIFDGSYPAKLTNDGLALKLNFHEDQIAKGDLCILDLNDKRYSEDFGSILPGCECLSCRKHTRAYIHHLINTREMLAQVLLTIHNLHHFDQMFRLCRHHIASNTFQIFKTSITEQYKLYAAAQEEFNRNTVETTEVSCIEQQERPKRKRMLDSDTKNGTNNGNIDRI